MTDTLVERPRIRKHRRLSYAKLTRQQVLAAHTLYMAGMSMPEICELGYHKWGFSRPEYATKSLIIAFKMEGLPIRTPSAARVALYRRRPELARAAADTLRNAPGNLSVTNREKTHCAKGHPLAGDNLYITTRGHRRCIACHRQWNREYRERRSERERAEAETA